VSFNGSGTFNINSAGQPVVSGTVISSSTFNTLTADLATGLSTCITKDGQTTVTANIPLNSYKITGLAAGTAATDAARVGQLQAGAASVVTAAGTDTYTGTMSPSLGAYAAGNTFTFVVPNTNTTAATLNIDGLGAKALTRDGSTALVAGDLVANAEVLVVYDGTRFQVLNSNSKTNFNLSGTLTVAGNTTLSGGTANGVAYLNASKVVTTGSGLTYSSTGNLYLAAPSSGTAFNINTGSGAVAIAMGNWPVMQYTGTTWQLGGLNAAQFTAGKLYTDGASRLEIATGGSVTINAPSSGTALTVNQSGSTSGVNNVAASGNNSVITISQTSVASWLLYSPASSTDFRINNGSGDLVTLSTSGNLGIGTTSPGARLDLAGTASGVSNNFRLTSFSFQNAFMLLNQPNTGNYRSFEFQEAGSTTAYLRQYGSAYGSGINSLVRLGNGSATLDFDSSGNLGLGVTPSAWISSWKVLQQSGISLASSSTIGIVGQNWYINSSGTDIYQTTAAASIYKQTAGAHTWSTAASGTAGNAITFTQAMTLDASGNWFVGNTSAANVSVTGGVIAVPSAGASYIATGHTTGTASGTGYSFFYYNGSNIGSITQSGTAAVLYNVTSDRRLKDNITDADSASDLIDAIKVRKFDWKSDGSHQRYGMIAQELHEVAPEAVHSPVDPDDMMAVDYSKLVPMLVKEIQSLRVRLNALENK
jgi:hypothetical protein